MFKGIEIGGKVVDRDSLRIEGNQVVDAQFKDGTDLTDKQLRLLSDMNKIAGLTQEIEMGHRTYQRILICDVCGETPENGEPMWEMCGEYWCEACCNKEESETEENVKS